MGGRVAAEPPPPASALAALALATAITRRRPSAVDVNVRITDDDGIADVELISADSDDGGAEDETVVTNSAAATSPNFEAIEDDGDEGGHWGNKMRTNRDNRSFSLDMGAFGGTRRHCNGRGHHPIVGSRQQHHYFGGAVSNGDDECLSTPQ